MYTSLLDRSALRSVAALGWAVVAVLLTIGSVHAGPIPANLGAGLYGLAADRYVATHPASGLGLQQQQAVSSEMMAVSNDDMLRDEANRVMVTIVVDGMYAYDAVRAAVAAVPGLSITAEDPKYRAGIMEGFVPVEALVTLAKTPGVSAIHAVHRPTTNVGAVTQQGVVQHRVDQISPAINGTGITIGVLSDSYNTGNHLRERCAADHSRGPGHRELRSARNRQPLRQYAAGGCIRGLRHTGNRPRRGPGDGATDPRHGTQGPPRRLRPPSAVKSPLPTTSARWPAFRACRIRGPALRRRSSSTTSSISTKACSPTPSLPRRSTTSRRWACPIFPRPATRRRRKAMPRIFASCRTAPARRPGRTSAWRVSPPTCTPAASTTSARDGGQDIAQTHEPRVRGRPAAERVDAMGRSL